MSTTIISSVDEFQKQLKLLATDEAEFIYRGQADIAWKVNCSAARRLNLDPTKPIENQLISPLLVGYLESLIDRARSRKVLPTGFNADSPDLELLAQLQHYGAATGLIDFTSNPMVALWFACNGSHSNDGAVFLLSRSTTKKVDTSGDLNERIQSYYEEDAIWSWEPPQRGDRIEAQDSVFVLGVPVISRLIMKELIVQADSKREILTHLETIWKVNEEELYPDFPGFAVANASNKAYDVSRSVSYWQEHIRLASNRNEKAKASYNCGVAYSAIREARNAVKQYTAAIELKPEARAYGNRGLAWAELGDHIKAIANYDRALCINPQYAIAYNNRGSAKNELDRPDEAIVDFNRALSIDPDLAGCYVNRGSAKTNLKRYEEAIQDYDAALRIHPEFAEAHFSRGMTRIDQERYVDAIADFDSAIAIDPEYADAFINRGAAKSWLGKHKEAIEDFSEALRIQPDDSEAYYNRGTTKTMLCLHKDAIADFSAAIELNPEHAQAFNSRGVANAVVGLHGDAIADFSAAIGIDPDNDEAYKNRGNSKAKSGLYKEAIADYDEAIRINPEDARVYMV